MDLRHGDVWNETSKKVELYMIHKSKYFLYLAICCLLSLSMPLAGYCESAYEQLQETAGHQYGNVSDKTINPALASMLAKQRSQERFWTEKIQKIDQEIQKCDKDIALANTIITKAQNIGKIEAEAVARQNLIKAKKLKQSRLEKKRIAEQQLHQAKETGKNLSGSLMDGSAPSDVRSVVSLSSGEVSLLRANSGPKATSLTTHNIEYLAPGDEIQTGNGSRAELQILSGRGAMTMGENSRLKVEEDNGDAEVVRTLEGKFHFVVDNAEKFLAALEKDLAGLKDTLAQTLDDSADTYERFIKSLKAKVQKKLESRTRGRGTASIRGTEFVVNENQDGSCEFVVIEGKVDVTEPNGEKSVMVETGHAVSISSDGKLSGIRQLDTAAILRWWEESP